MLKNPQLPNGSRKTAGNILIERQIHVELTVISLFKEQGLQCPLTTEWPMFKFSAGEFISLFT